MWAEWGKMAVKLGGGTWQTRWPQEPVGFKPVRVQIPPAAPFSILARIPQLNL